MSIPQRADAGCICNSISTCCVQMAETDRSRGVHVDIHASCRSSGIAVEQAAVPAADRAISVTADTVVRFAAGAALPRGFPIASVDIHTAASDEEADRVMHLARRASEPPTSCSTINTDRTSTVSIALAAVLASTLRNALPLTVCCALRNTRIRHQWWSSFFTGWPRYTRGFLRSCGALLLKIDFCSGLRS